MDLLTGFWDGDMVVPILLSDDQLRDGVLVAVASNAAGPF